MIATKSTLLIKFSKSRHHIDCYIKFQNIITHFLPITCGFSHKKSTWWTINLRLRIYDFYDVSVDKPKKILYNDTAVKPLRTQYIWISTHQNTLYRVCLSHIYSCIDTNEISRQENRREFTIQIFLLVLIQTTICLYIEERQFLIV